MPTNRDRVDRCPGALRPWLADDGLLVRLRLIGGAITAEELSALLGVAEAHGDGRVQLTGRANLQVRGLPGAGRELRPDVLAALEATGLVPTRTHELVRNVMVSPQSGLAGGRIDLRPVADELDHLLRADDRLALLPGRFLFVLDDGRGDLVDRSCDLGLVALDDASLQLRVGDGWAEVVPLAVAARELALLAGDFMMFRGTGPTAPWHVAELDVPLSPPLPADDRTPTSAAPLAYGPVDGGTHVAVPQGLLDRERVTELVEAATHLVVTPWRGVLVPEEDQ